MKELTKEQQFAQKMVLTNDLLLTYRAAKLSGANEQEATAVTASYLAGILIAARETRPDEREQGEQDAS